MSRSDSESPSTTSSPLTMDAHAEHQQLLFRPRPISGEDELAWLFRLARSNGFRSAAALLSSARLKITSHIAPISSDSRTAAWTALAIDVDVAVVLEALHDAVGAALGMPVHEQGLQRWRLVRCDSTSNMVKFAVCPSCLRADQEPHYRSAWRYAAVTRCAAHGAALLDRCRHCGSDIAISLRTDHELVKCRLCNSSLTTETRGALSVNVGRRDIPPVPATVDASVLPQAVAFEHLYWDGIWILLSHLLLRSTLKKLEISASIPLPYRCALEGVAASAHSGQKIRFESLGIDEREPLLSFVAWLCAGWPSRFVRVFSTAGLHWHTLSVRQIETPYWLAETFRWHLQRSRYRPSLEEAQAARDALELGSGRATRIRVKRALGVTESSSVSEAVAIYSRTFSRADLALLLEDLAAWVESATAARKQRASRVRDAAAISLCAVFGLSFTRVCLLLAQDVELLLAKHLSSDAWQLKVLDLADRWLSEYRRHHRPAFAEVSGLPEPYFFVTRFGLRYEGYGLPAVLSGSLRRIGFPDKWRGVSVFEDLHAISPASAAAPFA